VKVGNVTLRKSGLTGWEKRFTRGGDSDWELTVADGSIVRDPNDILKEMHAEGRRIKALNAQQS
jgi:hypothetical protein